LFGDADLYASHNAFFTEGGTPAVLRLLVGESLDMGSIARFVAAMATGPERP